MKKIMGFVYDTHMEKDIEASVLFTNQAPLFPVRISCLTSPSDFTFFLALQHAG